jgi:hypothetical protein
MITAILDMNNGQFETKMKMKEILRVIRIPLYLPLAFKFIEEPNAPGCGSSSYKILEFEWKKQENKR